MNADEYARLIRFLLKEADGLGYEVHADRQGESWEIWIGDSHIEINAEGVS
jgi:hypothetical protein